MSLGFVLIGMITGLGAGLTVWFAGAGFGLAFLTYVGCGVLGVGLAVGLALAGQGQTAEAGPIRQS